MVLIMPSSVMIFIIVFLSCWKRFVTKFLRTYLKKSVDDYLPKKSTIVLLQKVCWRQFIISISKNDILIAHEVCNYNHCDILTAYGTIAWAKRYWTSCILCNDINAFLWRVYHFQYIIPTKGTVTGERLGVLFFVKLLVIVSNRHWWSTYVPRYLNEVNFKYFVKILQIENMY